MSKSSSGKKSKPRSESILLTPENENVWAIAEGILLMSQALELRQYRGSAFLAEKLPDASYNAVMDGLLKKYDASLARAEAEYDKYVDSIPAWRKVRDQARAETRAKK